MDPEKTSILLARSHEGDDQSRSLLFARYRPLLARWAHGRIPSPARDAADTDDLVQVTMLRAFNHMDQFEPRRDGAFLAWLRRILWNEVQERMRKSARRGRPEELDERVPDPGRSPLQHAMDAEVIERYERALEGLSALDRSAVVLRLEFQLSYEEIAQELEIGSTNAARLRTGRAIRRLEQELQGLSPGG